MRLSTPALAAVLLAVEASGWAHPAAGAGRPARAAPARRSAPVRASSGGPESAPGDDELDGWLEGSDDDGELPAFKCSEAKVTKTLGEVSGAKLPDRFMYAQRALSGEFTPADEAADMEGGTGLLGGLLDFPAELEFTVVAERADEQQFLRELAELARQTAGLLPTATTARPRGSRFVNVKMKILVGSPDVSKRLHAAFLAHPAVRFTF